MKKLLLIFASIALMVACTESAPGDDGDDDKKPTPKPQTPSISLESGTSSNFSEEGGSGTISFTTSEAWSAEVINSRADSWVSIHPTSGGAGSATITVTTEPNDTPDDRSATIKIKAGTAEKSVKVSQKQKDALTVTATSFEVGAEGGEIEIEVKANIDFDYEIEGAAQDWVEHKGTRGMKTSTLTFAIAENDDTKKRDAKIYITSGEFNEEIAIYQAGAEPTIVISQDEYVVAAEGDTIAVEVSSNVDVTVELPEDAYWVTESATRATSTNTYYFNIEPNEDYDQRTAEIKFTNNENGLSEVVTVTQTQMDALVVAKESYTVSSKGDQIEIEVGHNVDFDIEISANWIKQAQNTRAFVTDVLVFDIAANTTNDNREGTITFKSKDGSLKQTVKVYQQVEGTIIVSAKEIELGPEAGTFTVEVQANVEFSASTSLANWIRRVEPTRGMSSHTLYYEYDENPTSEVREAYIYITTADKEEVITVTQNGSEMNEDDYVLLGAGMWTDDIVAPFLGYDASTYEVEVYENPDKPGFIYLKDLYTNAYKGVLENSFGIDPSTIPTWDTSYFAIDISDPEAVNIPNQSIGLDIGLGEMSTWSLEPGTYKNGVISFYTKGLAIHLPKNEASYYTNNSGLTKLVMPESDTPEEDSYELIGTGRWTDDIVAPWFGLEAPTYEVEVYENPAKPGFIYLKDLYTNAYKGVLENSFGIDASDIPTWETSYFAIDISDPEAVNIPHQGIGLDLGYGEMYIWSLESGTYKNGVISFPTQGLVVEDDEEAAYANDNGKTKLDMNEEETPDNPNPGEEDTYELMGTGSWTDDIVAPLFGYDVSTYEVEVYENPATPGVIYLKDLYTNAYAGVLENSFGIDASDIPTWETSYFAIDVSDPAAVNIDYQPTGLNLGYGNMGIWSLETGKLENGILTFPTRGLVIDLPDDNAYYANKNGKTRLVLPGYDNGLYESTDYSKDGEVKVLQEATKGKGIDIVFMGDAYSDRLIADGTYDNVMKTAMDKFFTEEPYKSFRDHFNVYSVTAVSKNEGYSTGIEETCFATYFGAGTLVGGNDQRVFLYTENAIGEERVNDALIIVMMNSTAYAGTCWSYYPSNGDWGNGVSISYFPVGKDDEALAQVLKHEAGGHGFSKLGDEYSYESMGRITAEVIENNNYLIKYGWRKNVDFTSDPLKIKWSHFLSDERYAGEGLGAYEGGLTYWSGVWRPTYNSIMRHNTDGFNAPSREAIYYRIHKLAYGADWEYDYEEFVEWDARNRKAESRTVVPYRLDVPEDFVPLHPPVLVKSSWRDAKKSTHRMGTKSLTITEQAKALTEQARVKALANAKAGAIRKDGKLQKVAATPYKRPQAAIWQNNKLEIKGDKITSSRK